MGFWWSQAIQLQILQGSCTIDRTRVLKCAGYLFFVGQHVPLKNTRLVVVRLWMNVVWKVYRCLRFLNTPRWNAGKHVQDKQRSNVIWRNTRVLCTAVIQICVSNCDITVVGHHPRIARPLSILPPTLEASMENSPATRRKLETSQWAGSRRWRVAAQSCSCWWQSYRLVQIASSIEDSWHRVFLLVLFKLTYASTVASQP